jgi:DNA-binding MarR family transcriptional regulator
MHTVLFSLHRSDLTSIAFQRGLLEPYGISPARYTMLFAIEQQRAFGFIRQSDLRRELGVTAATVSVMVRSLERLGLVRRTRLLGTDRRPVHVMLTDSAKWLLRAIRRRVIRLGVVWVALYSALSYNGAFDGAAVGTLKEHLDRLRAKLGDRARLHFPWCHLTLSQKRPPRRKTGA